MEAMVEEITGVAVLTCWTHHISTATGDRRWFFLPWPNCRFSATQKRNSGSDLRPVIVHARLAFSACGPFRTASLLGIRYLPDRIRLLSPLARTVRND